MLHGFNFSESVLSTLVFTCSSANISHILQYQKLIYCRCAAYNQSNWWWRDFSPDHAIIGKSQKRIERSLWTFNWFSETNFKTVIFQLAWFSCLFDASLVPVSFLDVATLIQPHAVHVLAICASFRVSLNWQFRRIDRYGSHKPVSLLPPSSWP